MCVRSEWVRILFSNGEVYNGQSPDQFNGANATWNYPSSEYSSNYNDLEWNASGWSDQQNANQTAPQIKQNFVLNKRFFHLNRHLSSLLKHLIVRCNTVFRL